MEAAVGMVVEQYRVWDCHRCCTNFAVRAALEGWMDKASIALKRMLGLEPVRQLVVAVVRVVCWPLQRVVVLGRRGLATCLNSLAMSSEGRKDR